MNEAFELDEHTCRELLSAGLVGRIAVCTEDGPHVVPVNFTVVGDAVVVRTTAYSVLGRQPDGAVMAVEVDGVDYEHHRGWSVVARGRGRVVTEAQELEDIQATWPPRAWASGTRTRFIRVRWTELTGRQLGRGWDPLTTLPVRRHAPSA